MYSPHLTPFRSVIRLSPEGCILITSEQRSGGPGHSISWQRCLWRRPHNSEGSAAAIVASCRGALVASPFPGLPLCGNPWLLKCCPPGNSTFVPRFYHYKKFAKFAKLVKFALTPCVSMRMRRILRIALILFGGDFDASLNNQQRMGRIAGAVLDHSKKNLMFLNPKLLCSSV